MYVKQPKKMLIINILDILRRYSDAEHRLSQRDIVDYLKRDYHMDVERKAVRRNIMNLMEFGYNIEYTETVRKTPDPKTGELQESYIWTDYYLERQFTDSELRLLIDSLLFSGHVPAAQCRELVGKLESLSNMYFKSRVTHIDRLHGQSGDNQQLFLNIELLDEAIHNRKKVAFHYMEYGTDKKSHVRRRLDGTVREYIINPYQMAAREGKYYLICNYDKYDTVSNYRIDRICDIRILDESVKPFESLRGANGNALDLSSYMKEHVYMYAGSGTHAVFRAKKSIISDVIDLFGKDIQFSEEKDDTVTVSVSANELAVEQFAKRFVTDVTVLSPELLKNKIRYDLAQAAERYAQDD